MCLVKYSNRLNTLGIRSMSKIENDVFYALLGKLKDQQEQSVNLTLTELKCLIGQSRQRNDYIQKALLKMAEKFSQFVVRYENDKEKRFFSVFEVLTIPNEEPTIKAKLSNQFLHLLNNLENEFTLFDLAIYTSFSSRHSQTIYRLLKQFSSTGYYKTTMENFKNTLNIPASYQLSNIDKRILEQAIKDFKKRKIFQNLTIQKIKSKTGKGNKVTHLEFIFTPETKSKFDELQQLENTTPKDLQYAESVANRQQILENQKAKQQIKQHDLAALAAGCNALKVDEPIDEREARIKKEVQRMNMSNIMKAYALRTFSYKSNYYKIWNFEYNADGELVLFVKDENDKIVRYNHTFKSCEHLDNYMKDYLT